MARKNSSRTAKIVAGAAGLVAMVAGVVTMVAGVVIGGQGLVDAVGGFSSESYTVATSSPSRRRALCSPPAGTT